MNSDMSVKITKTSKLPNDAAKFMLFGNNLEQHFETNGKILSDSRYSWLSVGPQVTIINNQNGSKKNIWLVNNLMRDSIVKVTCVSEIPAEWPGGVPLLAIGCEDGSLYIYHSGVSRTLRTIQFTESITAIEVIDMGVRKNLLLPEELQLMNGVLAIGLFGGAVYLIDLSRNRLERSLQEGSTPRNEIVSELLEIDLHNDCETDIREKQSRAHRNGGTLALLLNERAFAQPKIFSVPSNEKRWVTKYSLPQEDVSVTCLKYLKEIACLAIGFNFSCTQLWHLPTLEIKFVSPLMEKVVLPVVGFCLQEPSDDPKHVCYLWVVHQSSGTTVAKPLANMYTLIFKKKRYIRDYGPFYEECTSCKIGYELDFGDTVKEAFDGRIISSYCVSKSLPRRLSHYFIDQEVEESIVNIFAIAWEVWTPDRYDVTTKLTIFDLNQWYKAQIPNCGEYVSFISTLSLSSVNQAGALLDVKILPNSLRQFVALQPLDEHFFPLSLTFDCLCLTETDVFKCSWQGIQHTSLNKLDSDGPSLLQHPDRTFQNFLCVGLKPSFYDVHEFATEGYKRQVVLTVMLENGYINFLKNCIGSWANGCLAVAECTLPFLLEWGWNMVTLYKQVADKLCVELFDYSGSKPNTTELAFCIRLLHTLSDLFNFMLNNFHHLILEDNIKRQSKSLELVVLYLDSILWCVENKILPEMLPECTLPKGIAYNVQSLQTKIISWRTEANRLGRLLSHTPEGGLLLIDALIYNEAGGARVTDQWEREGGGLYPPPSIQSMLRVNLMNGIPVHVKLSILLYFLMDLFNELPKKRECPDINDIINQFSIVFRFNSSRLNIIRGFWCIDNKKFEEGIKYLSNSLVSRNDITPWQHRTVLRSLFIQHQAHVALNYLRVMTPQLCEPEDIKFELSVLLECELFLQAFEFQRKYKDLQLELLNNFFHGCMQKKQLGIVYKLSLTKFEEESFTVFLEKAQHPHSEDLRVLYLLSRARYVEAIDVNEKMRLKRVQNSIPTAVSSPLKGAAKDIIFRGSAKNLRNTPSRFKTESRESLRDVIVNGFAKTLPPVTRELADYCLKHKAALASWKQVERPTPLSVVVHTVEDENKVPVYRGSNEMLMQSALMKTREIWAPLLATPALSKSKFRSSVEDTPFLRSAVLSKSLRSSPEHDLYRLPGSEKKRDRDELVDEKTAAKRFKFDEEAVGNGSPIRSRDRLLSVLSKSITDKENIDEVDCPLLRTPLIKKKVVSVTPQKGTPQSILKSPWKGKGTPRGKHTPAKESPITFAKDITVYEPEYTSEVDANEPQSGWASPLPRQIRFSLPNDDTDSNDSINYAARVSNDSLIASHDNSSHKLSSSHQYKKEVYDIDDSFEDENELDANDDEDKIDQRENEEKDVDEVDNENNLAGDEVTNDEDVCESDVETYATLSSRTSTITVSYDDIDTMSVSQPTSRLSSATSSTTNEYVSVSEDNKESTDQETTLVISVQSSKNHYQRVTDEELSSEEGIHHAVQATEEIENDSTIKHFQQNLSESVPVEEPNYKDEENVQLNSSASIETLDNDKGSVKIYTSLKPVGDYCLDDEDEAVLGDLLGKIGNDKNSESDGEKKTASAESLEHEEFRNGSGEESEQEDEECIPGGKYNADATDEEEEEEEDEDIYTGLGEDGGAENNDEDDEKYVSESSDVICLDSDSQESEANVRSKSNHKRYSEELDYEDYERDDFIEEEEEGEEENNKMFVSDTQRHHVQELEEEDEEFDEDDEGENNDEDERSFTEEEEEDDDDDDEDDDRDTSASENSSDGRKSVNDIDIDKNFNGKFDSEVKDDTVKANDAIMISEKIEEEQLVGTEEEKKEIIITEVNSMTSDTQLQQNISISVEDEKVPDNEKNQACINEEVSISTKIILGNEEIEINAISDSSKDVKEIQDNSTNVEEKLADEKLLDISEDDDVLKLHITTDLSYNSTLHEEDVGHLSVINEEPSEIKTDGSAFDCEKEVEEDFSVPLSSFTEQVKYISKPVDKSDKSFMIEDNDKSRIVLDNKSFDKSIRKESMEISDTVQRERRLRRRSKSVDNFAPVVDGSMSLHKSSTFTGAEQLCGISKEIVGKDAMEVDNVIREKGIDNNIKFISNDDPSTSKASVHSHRRSSSSRSRRSSSVSQLSEMSSRYHSRSSSRRFGSTSSMLLEITKSSDSTYASTSKFDTSLGMFIKKIKHQNQNKPCQSVKSSAVHYRSSIKVKSSNPETLHLNVLSSSEEEEEIDNDSKQLNKVNKTTKKQQVLYNASTSEGNHESPQFQTAVDSVDKETPEVRKDCSPSEHADISCTETVQLKVEDKSSVVQYVNQTEFISDKEDVDSKCQINDEQTLDQNLVTGKEKCLVLDHVEMQVDEPIAHEETTCSSNDNQITIATVIENVNETPSEKHDVTVEVMENIDISLDTDKSVICAEEGIDNKTLLHKEERFVEKSTVPVETREDTTFVLKSTNEDIANETLKNEEHKSKVSSVVKDIVASKNVDTIKGIMEKTLENEKHEAEASSVVSDSIVSENVECNEVNVEETSTYQKHKTRASLVVKDTVASEDAKTNEITTDKTLEHESEASSVVKQNLVSENPETNIVKMEEFSKNQKRKTRTSLIVKSTFPSENVNTNEIIMEENLEKEKYTERDSSVAVDSEMLEKAKSNEATLEENLKNLNRKTRASSVVKDIVTSEHAKRNKVTLEKTLTNQESKTRAGLVINDSVMSENLETIEVTLKETMENQKRQTRASSVASKPDVLSISEIAVENDKKEHCKISPVSFVDSTSVSENTNVNETDIEKKYKSETSSVVAGILIPKSSDLGEITLEDILKNKKRTTRASSVVSDVTSLTSDRSSLSTHNKHGKLHRKKSISFDNVNDNKSSHSRRYSSRRIQRSGLSELVRGMDSYRKSQAFDPHKSRASSVSSIDENVSSISYREGDSRRSVRQSRFMDRSSLKKSFLQPLPFDIDSSDDETEAISYTETLKGRSAFRGLVDKIGSKKHSPSEIEEKLDPNSPAMTATPDFKKENVIIETPSEETVSISRVSDEEKEDKSQVERVILRSRKIKSFVSEEKGQKIPKESSPKRSQKAKVISKEPAETVSRSPSVSPERSSPDTPLVELKSSIKIVSDKVERSNNETTNQGKTPTKRRKQFLKSQKQTSGVDVEKIAVKDTESDSDGLEKKFENDSKSKKMKRSSRQKVIKETLGEMSESTSEHTNLVEQTTVTDSASDSGAVSNSDIENVKKPARAKKLNKRKLQVEHDVSSSQESIPTEKSKNRRKLISRRRKSHSVDDVSKATTIFEESESGNELRDSNLSLVEAPPTPDWRKVLRSSKLLDVPPPRQSKLKDEFDYSLEVIPSEEEEVEGDGCETEKKSKPSPKGKSVSKKRTSRKSVDAKVENEESSNTPGKRKRSGVVSSHTKKRKSVLSNQEETDDDDRLSVCSEPARSSLPRIKKGSKSVRKSRQQKELYDIIEEQQPEENTPKRNLRSSSIVTDTGSADSKRSSRTAKSEILPKRRSLFSTPQKTPDCDSSTIDDYTTQRRLTRHQKSLLERSLDFSSTSK